MRIASTLEGEVVIVQDDLPTARRIELALGQAGATVFTTVDARHTLELMWRIEPFAVVMNPSDDLAGAIFVWANARDNKVPVIQYVDGRQGHGGGIRISRGAPVQDSVDMLLEAAASGVADDLRTLLGDRFLRNRSGTKPAANAVSPLPQKPGSRGLKRFSS